LRFVTSIGSPRRGGAHCVPPLHVCPLGLLTCRRVLREEGVRSSHSVVAPPCRSRSPWDGCVVREVAPVVLRPPVGPWAGCSPGLLPKQVTSGDVASSLRGLWACRGLLRVPGESSSPCGAAPSPSGRSPRGVRSGAGRSAPRPCSTDESVMFQLRFRVWNTLSFHGLGSPPRSLPVRSSLPRVSRVRPRGLASVAFVGFGSLLGCGHTTSGSFLRRSAGGRLWSLSDREVALPASLCRE
jgi:hypothetical protein